MFLVKMRLTACILILLVFGGCSSGSFLGKRFDNFTAYYNTFYNAQKSFDAASKAAKAEDARVDRSTYMRVIAESAAGGGTRDFENAIKKSADVLRDHPNSKWVDDALLLIGKSYYHTNNTVGAEEKFREVIQRGSKLEDEARFWLGLTLIASGALEEAGTHLRESIDRERVDRKWKAKMQAVLGELYVRQERWQEAAETLEEATSTIKDDRLGCRAQFLLGQVYETLQRYDEAIQAYKDVSHFNPLYELSYAAKFNTIRLEGIHGDVEEALKALRKMERDDKNFQYRAELRYLRALILQNTGFADDAVAEYDRLLYDADANISTIRGQIHYQLGVIYRDLQPDFPRAAAHFDTASTALRAARPSGTGTAARATVLAPAPGAVTDAADQAKVFGNYAHFHELVARLDSLLYLGSLDEEAFREKIHDIRRQRAEELLAERERQRSLDAQQRFGRSAGFEDSRTTSGATAANAQTGSAGFLFHRDRSRVQENLLAFFETWGDRPLVVNWRRRAAVTGNVDRTTDSGPDAVEEALAQLPEGASATEEALLSSVEVDISDVPRTPERIAEVEAERAVAAYELANVLFLSIALPDSAASWYRRVVEDNPDLPVASRALYAIGEVHRSLGDTSSAYAVYRRVVEEYPDSEVAGRAAERVGIQMSNTEVVGESGGDADYDDAYALWKNGSLEPAARSMLTVAARYAGQEVAPRALLASAAVVVDWSDSHDRDVLDPVDMDIPDSLWSAVGLDMTPPAPAEQANDSTAARPDATAATTGGAASVEVPVDTSETRPDSTGLEVESPAERHAEQHAADSNAVDGGPLSEPLQLQSPDSTARSRNAPTDTPADLQPVRQRQRRSNEAGETVSAGAEHGEGAHAGDTSQADSPSTPDPRTVARVSVPDSLVSGARTVDGRRRDGGAVATQVPVSADTTRSGAASVTEADTTGSEPSAHGVAPPKRPVFLEDIYTLIVDGYPETEYARVAGGLRETVTLRRREREAAKKGESAKTVAAGDTTQAAPPDTLAAVANGTVTSAQDEDVWAVPPDSSGARRDAESKKESLLNARRVRAPAAANVADSAAAAPDADVTAPLNGEPTPADTIATEVDQLPVVVGGTGALQRMMKYPVEAQQGHITGAITVSVVVDERGQVSDIKVEHGPGAGCNEEAARVMGLARYRPAMKDGKPVRYRMVERLACTPTNTNP